MKTPEFSNLAWQEDGKRAEYIFIHEYITLSCDTKNIPHGQDVIVEIVEPDEEGVDEYIFDVEGKKNDKLKLQWQADYREKPYTKSKKEIDEKVYTAPEYPFYVRYFGFGIESRSAVKLKCNFIEPAINKNGNPMPYTDYILITPDGRELFGKTNSKGFVRQESLYIGKRKMVIAKGYAGRFGI
ncbi:MAG: hypothetical protein LBK73_04305 [Treponema sp.]|jgi:hypothetical protein|nr:hypothetical protein [Treponema sp.]